MSLPGAVPDGLAQAALVRRGAVSAQELARAAIERIERLDPRLNALVSERFERALAEPPAAGPFHGVPFLLKDAVCHSAGDPYHYGMRALKQRNWIERADAPLARRFRAAGLVPLGRTNTPELAASATTEPLAYGATRNPWDPARSPAGSSGGSAAAVAAGLVAIAHGNDMGGSIRLPAAACGIVGLKPSRGRVPLGDVFAPGVSEHVLTRSVRDSAAVLDAIAGADPGGPLAAPAPRGTFLAATARDPLRLRVGVLVLVPDGDPAVAPPCRAALDATAGLLARLGHALVEVDCPPFWEERPDGAVGCALLAHELDRLAQRSGAPIELAELEPLTADAVRAGREVTVADFLAGQAAEQRWARRVSASWRDACDVLLLPTLPDLPPPLGRLAPLALPPERLGDEIARMAFFTWPFNLTGEPAISLPLWWTEEGLPVGVQLVAGHGEEERLLALAGQLERSAPWATRYETAALHADVG